MEGRCQCGLITFTTPTPKPNSIHICHCTRCRHQSSSAFGISAVFPRFHIPPPASAPEELRTIICETSTEADAGKRAAFISYFCGRCGSTLMHDDTRARGGVEISPPEVTVKGGSLTGLTKELMSEAWHMWCQEAVVEIPQGVRRYDTQPSRD